MIIYTKDSLFNQNGYLVHAVNAQGVWGSGIAKEFKERFPKSFLEYEQFCTEEAKRHDEETYLTVGECFITSENVVCLVTSDHYGKDVSEKKEILRATRSSLRDFLIDFKERNNGLRIYSNKFNSGLFNVPWKDTERILEELTEEYKVNWVVCDPDLDVQMGDYTKLIVNANIDRVDESILKSKIEKLGLCNSAYHAMGRVEQIQEMADGYFNIVLVGQTKYGRGQEEFLNWLKDFVTKGSGKDDIWSIQIDEFSDNPVIRKLV